MPSTYVRLRWWNARHPGSSGLEAALAFELFHPELTEAGDQGLVPVQDVEAAGFAAGSLNLDLDQLLSFIAAETPGFLG